MVLGFFWFWTVHSRRTQSKIQTIAENPVQGHEKLTKCRTYTKKVGKLRLINLKNNNKKKTNKQQTKE